MVHSKRLSWRIELALTIRAPKSWPDVVDRYVEQRSRNEARCHERPAARQILMPRALHRFHRLSPPANARLQSCKSDAPLPADWTMGCYPHHEAIMPWQRIMKFESRQNWVESLAVNNFSVRQNPPSSCPKLRRNRRNPPSPPKMTANVSSVRRETAGSVARAD
jgi:hypothetical protein